MFPTNSQSSGQSSGKSSEKISSPIKSLETLSHDYSQLHRNRRVTLTYSEFLNIVSQNPRHHMRNAPMYLKDMFDHFGIEESEQPNQRGKKRRFKLFDLGTEQGVAIIGGEHVQEEIYHSLKTFVDQGRANKLIFLHGPNGSAKSSTLDTIAHGMNLYSETEDGAVYTFNWIFSTEKNAMPKVRGESSTIGFGAGQFLESSSKWDSYAMLDESLIASKITSEFKENPLFLIPMPFREKIIGEMLKTSNDKTQSKDFDIPEHMLKKGLSKRNQLIFENLLNAYGGEIEKVFRHIQVERFFYSKQYRTGISTIEPQMSIDAQEKILTMDKNVSNLPSVLHNIRFSETHGELVEANRGFLEFSDLLKRPVETFKYLLTTVEKGTLSLPSSTALLDCVFFATSNEKHLDGFKNLPDFASFRGRFELIKVPYLTKLSDEIKIYQRDLEIIKKSKPVAPHTLEMLCMWAVMTRLKQPDPENYSVDHTGLILKLDPLSKSKLYDNKTLYPDLLPAEEKLLKHLKAKIETESNGSAIYEGRFGASPREVTALFYRIAQQSSNKILTPMTIFRELEHFIKDRSVYDFLQFEPRQRYHDVNFFIECLREEFARIFEHEVLVAMNFVGENEYEKLLARYIQNTVADVKKEKLFNRNTESYETPSEQLMTEIEKIIGVTSSAHRYRENILNKIASFKIENPKDDIDFNTLFQDILIRIKDHYHKEKSVQIHKTLKVMLTPETDTDIDSRQLQASRKTYEELERRFGYDHDSAKECVKFLMSRHKS